MSELGKSAKVVGGEFESLQPLKSRLVGGTNERLRLERLKLHGARHSRRRAHHLHRARDIALVIVSDLSDEEKVPADHRYSTATSAPSFSARSAAKQALIKSNSSWAEVFGEPTKPGMRSPLDAGKAE